MSDDYYALLRLSATASPADITAAYDGSGAEDYFAIQAHMRPSARVCWRICSAGGNCMETFLRIRKAYEVLSDACARERYDAERRVQRQDVENKACDFDVHAQGWSMRVPEHAMLAQLRSGPSESLHTPPSTPVTCSRPSNRQRGNAMKPCGVGGLWGGRIEDSEEAVAMGLSDHMLQEPEFKLIHDLIVGDDEDAFSAIGEDGRPASGTPISTPRDSRRGVGHAVHACAGPEVPFGTLGDENTRGCTPFSAFKPSSHRLAVHPAQEAPKAQTRGRVGRRERPSGRDVSSGSLASQISESSGRATPVDESRGCTPFAGTRPTASKATSKKRDITSSAFQAKGASLVTSKSEGTLGPNMRALSQALPKALSKYAKDVAIGGARSSSSGTDSDHSSLDQRLSCNDSCSSRECSVGRESSAGSEASVQHRVKADRRGQQSSKALELVNSSGTSQQLKSEKQSRTRSCSASSSATAASSHSTSSTTADNHSTGKSMPQVTSIGGLPEPSSVPTRPTTKQRHSRHTNRQLTNVSGLPPRRELPPEWGKQNEFRLATVSNQVPSHALRHAASEGNLKVSMKLPGIGRGSDFSFPLETATDENPATEDAPRCFPSSFSGTQERPASRGSTAADKLMRKLQWGAYSSSPAGASAAGVAGASLSRSSSTNSLTGMAGAGSSEPRAAGQHDVSAYSDELDDSNVLS